MARSGPRRGIGAGTRAAAALLLVCAALWGRAGAAQTWFDGLVAQVNNEAILASDITLEDALFGAGRTYAEMDAEARRAVLGRLIDRRLLVLEAARFQVAVPSEAAVSDAVARLERERPGPLGGFDPAVVRERVRRKLWADAFVQARIRAFVFIRDSQVDQALAEAGTPLPESEAERAALEDKTRKALADREAERRLQEYIARLEGRATIRLYPLSGPAPS
jgi:hypothetical protein